MISAQILIALAEPPRNREARDDAAKKILGLVRSQDRHTCAIQVFFSHWFIQFEQLLLPLFPVNDVLFTQVFVWLMQAGTNLLAGLRPNAPKTEGQNKIPLAGRQINFPRQSDVPIFRALIFPGHAEML